MITTIPREELEELPSFLDIDYGIHITKQEADNLFEVCESSKGEDFISNFIDLIANIHEIKPLHDGNYILIDQLIRSHMHVISNDRLMKAYNEKSTREQFISDIKNAVTLMNSSVIVNGIAHTPLMGWIMACAHYGCTDIVVSEGFEFNSVIYPPEAVAYLAIGSLKGFNNAAIREVWNDIGLNSICSFDSYDFGKLRPAIELAQGDVWKGKVPEFTVYTSDPICSKVCAWALTVK